MNDSTHRPAARHALPSGIGSMATRQMLAALANRYEAETGAGIALTAIGGVAAEQRLMDGAAFDFAVLASAALDRLAAAGRLSPARFDIARSHMAAAVPSGTPHPDIGSAAALRDTLLRTARIAYSTGPSGDHVLRMIESWGLTERLRDRLVQAPAGVPVAELIARGQADFGFQQFSELMHAPGIDVLDTLPGEARAVTVFAAAVCAEPRQREGTEAFLAYLVSHRSAAIIHAHGMQPMRPV